MIWTGVCYWKLQHLQNWYGHYIQDPSSVFFNCCAFQFWGIIFFKFWWMKWVYCLQIWRPQGEGDRFVSFVMTKTMTKEISFLTNYSMKVRSDHRSKFSNLSNWKETWKNQGFRASRWSPDFFRLLSNCLNWKIYCDDHSSLSSTTAVDIWIYSYKLHKLQYENLYEKWHETDERTPQGIFRRKLLHQVQ